MDTRRMNSWGMINLYKKKGFFEKDPDKKGRKANTELAKKREERKIQRSNMSAEERIAFDKQKQSEYFKEYYEKNKGKLKKRRHELGWYEKNKGKIKKYQKEYRKKKRIEQGKTAIFKPMTEKQKKQREQERYIRYRDSGIFRERKKKWYEKNKDKARENNRRYLEKHPEKRKERREKYNELHKEEIKAKRRERYIKNRDEILKKRKERYQKTKK